MWPRAEALRADAARPAPQRPAVPAELPARELARLSLLGQRAGAVSRFRRSRRAGPRRGPCDAPGERDHDVPSGERQAEQAPGRLGAADHAGRSEAGCRKSPTLPAVCAGAAAAIAGAGEEAPLDAGMIGAEDRARHEEQRQQREPGPAPAPAAGASGGDRERRSPSIIGIALLTGRACRARSPRPYWKDRRRRWWRLRATSDRRGRVLAARHERERVIAGPRTGTGTPRSRRRWRRRRRGGHEIEMPVDDAP